MVSLERMRNAVSEFITGAKRGPYVPEVLSVRDGREAEAARAKRAAATRPWAVSEDAEVRLADATREAVAQQLESARTILSELSPPAGEAPAHPEVPAARRLVRDLESAVAEAEAWSAEAVRATTAWVHRLRRPALQQIDAEYAAALAPAAARAAQCQAYREETTRLAGQRDPDDPGHPLPLLLAHGEAIARAATWWTPKPTPSLPPPRPGMTRVRVLKPFHDHDAALGILRHPTDIYDMTAALVPEALAKQLVEVIEA